MSCRTPPRGRPHRPRPIASVLAFALLLLLGGCRLATPSDGAAAVAGGAVERLRSRGYLVAAVAQDRPPFGSLSSLDGRPVGFDVDLARALAVALVGPATDVRFVAPSAAVRANLVFGQAPGPETTRAYYTARLGILVKRGSPVTGLLGLDGRLLGVVEGSPADARVIEAATQAGARPVPEFFPAYPPALAALGEGRVEALAGELPVLRALRGLDPNTRIVAAGFGDAGYAIGAPAELLPAVAAALDRLLADEPAWQRRLRRWGLGA